MHLFVIPKNSWYSAQACGRCGRSELILMMWQKYVQYICVNYYTYHCLSKYCVTNVCHNVTVMLLDRGTRKDQRHGWYPLAQHKICQTLLASFSFRQICKGAESVVFSQPTLSVLHGRH
jgi:hypothetical protein